jgi:hypothetical protein
MQFLFQMLSRWSAHSGSGLEEVKVGEIIGVCSR